MSWKRPWKEIRDIEERLYPEFLDNIDIKEEAKDCNKIHYLITELSNKYTDKFKEQFYINNQYEGDDTCVLCDFIEEDEFISYLKRRYPEIILYDISYTEFNFE